VLAQQAPYCLSHTSSLFFFALVIWRWDLRNNLPGLTSNPDPPDFSLSKVAGITGVSHWCPAEDTYFLLWIVTKYYFIFSQIVLALAIGASFTWLLWCSFHIPTSMVGGAGGGGELSSVLCSGTDNCSIVILFISCPGLRTSHFPTHRMCLRGNTSWNRYGGEILTVFPSGCFEQDSYAYINRISNQFVYLFIYCGTGV
jgi:hypothetical protein